LGKVWPGAGSFGDPVDVVRKATRVVVKRTRPWFRWDPRFGLRRDAALIFWAMVLWDFGIGLYLALWPLYIESLGASPFEIGLLIGGYGLLRIALTLPSGIVADRASRRKLIIGTTFISVPSVLGYGFAQEWWHLIPPYFLMAMSNFGLPALSSYIADAAGVNRARAFTLIYVVGPSAALILSPVIGGWLGDQFSLRVPFFLSAACYLAATVVFAFIRERPHAATHSGPTGGYRAAVQLPAVRWVSALQFGVLAVLTIGVTLLPNYLEDVHEIGIQTIGWYGGIAAVGSILLSLAISRLRFMTASRGIALATVSVGIVCAMTLVGGNSWFLAVAFLMRGGFSVAWSLFAAVLGDVTPQHLRGRAFALAEFLGGIGYGLAPFAAGALFGWRSGAPLAITALTAAPVALLALWVERRYVRSALTARDSEAATEEESDTSVEQATDAVT
jgi:MFS family permease